MIRLLLGLAAMCAMGLGTANAQDSEGGETVSTEDQTAMDAGSSEAADDAAIEEADERSLSAAEKELEADLARFWGSRRKVKVVQRRLFAKDGRFETAIFGGVIPNDDFIVYYPTGLRLSYHFSEAFTVEASFAEAIDSNTDLTNFLEQEIDLKRADIQEVIKRYYNVNILWAPVYGKISLLGMKLSHFETYVGTGFGFFHTHETPEDNPAGQAATKAAGSAIFGFRWFINNSFNVRTEYRQHFFQKFQGGVSIPVELTLGVGFTI